MAEFWEDLSLKLLEMNLNGAAINQQILEELFHENPDLRKY